MLFKSSSSQPPRRAQTSRTGAGIDGDLFVGGPQRFLRQHLDQTRLGARPARDLVDRAALELAQRGLDDAVLEAVVRDHHQAAALLEAMNRLLHQLAQSDQLLVDLDAQSLEGAGRGVDPAFTRPAPVARSTLGA